MYAKYAENLGWLVEAIHIYLGGRNTIDAC